MMHEVAALLRTTHQSTELAFRIFILGPWQPPATCRRCYWVPSVPPHMCWHVAGHKSGQSRERPHAQYAVACRRHQPEVLSLSGLRPVKLSISVAPAHKRARHPSGCHCRSRCCPPVDETAYDTYIGSLSQNSQQIIWQRYNTRMLPLSRTRQLNI